MKLFVSRLFILGLSFFLIALPIVNGRPSADDKNGVVKKARSAYYNLKDAGLTSFQCAVTVNWDRSAPTFPKDDPFSTEKGRQAMNAIKFPLAVSMDGGFDLSAPTIAYTGDPNLDKRLSNSPAYVNQMMGNFFQAWRSFAVGTFLPSSDSNYVVKETVDKYQITYKENGTNVDLNLAKDYQVSDLTINATDFKIHMQPTFIKTTKGFLISGVDSDATDPGGVQIHITLGIKYQNVEGFALPTKVSYDITTGKTLTSFDVSFIDYKIKKN